MAKARFSYVPNIPTPGEAQLAGAGPNDPVAGIHLLNAQMERRAGIDAYNATMEQVMEEQNKQAQETSRIEMMKAMLTAAGEFGQAPAAMQVFPEQADSIQQMQQAELQSMLSENFGKVASGSLAARQAGIQTGTSPLAAVSMGDPSQLTMGQPLALEEQALQNQGSMDVARTNAGATRDAAALRGQSETRPKVTAGRYDPASLTTYTAQGGDLSTVQGLLSPIVSGGQAGAGSIPDAEWRNAEPVIKSELQKLGLDLPLGSKGRYTQEGGRQIIVVDAIDPSTGAIVPKRFGQ